MGTSEASQSRLDRRAALKKAAVAGTIAWTAPAVLSSRAHAAEFIPGTPCTLKCVPTLNLNFDGDTGLFCTENGRKWARLDFTVDPEPCPCGPLGPVVIYGVALEPNPAEVKDIIYDPATRSGSVIIGGAGEGALGNGTYQFAVRACTTCSDRDGDQLSVTCTTGVQFSFSPGDGPCSSALNVGEVVALPEVCDPPACTPCPATL